ncbi:putative acetyltransferase NATA1-like [Zostera marina]|uniref:Putative acetyltransferase NATA1-like n=1 Tax=Zostera marina TaxID=29655 RepID=A0A0K9PRC8_ZOSMR|nr:putative acetyltransferase NATA1-like [Zostera marina]
MSSSVSASAGTKVLARVRLATVSDIPQIYRMIHQMAEFERLTDHFSATESLLSSTLFPTAPNHSPPPFYSFTVFIVDLNRNLVRDVSDDTNLNPHFTPMLREVDLVEGEGSVEGERLFFEKEKNGWEVAGFVLFFPNYSTFLSKPGFYVEDLFVRKEFRRQGLGTMLLSTVAKKATEMGMGRVEWCVIDWNVNAIDFYQEKMGAKVLPEWKICRLTDDALQAYAHKED